MQKLQSKKQKYGGNRKYSKKQKHGVNRKYSKKQKRHNKRSLKSKYRHRGGTLATLSDDERLAIRILTMAVITGTITSLSLSNNEVVNMLVHFVGVLQSAFNIGIAVSTNAFKLTYYCIKATFNFILKLYVNNPAIMYSSTGLATGVGLVTQGDIFLDRFTNSSDASMDRDIEPGDAGIDIDRNDRNPGVIPMSNGFPSHSVTPSAQPAQASADKKSKMQDLIMSLVTGRPIIDLTQSLTGTDILDNIEKYREWILANNDENGTLFTMLEHIFIIMETIYRIMKSTGVIVGNSMVNTCANILGFKDYIIDALNAAPAAAAEPAAAEAAKEDLDNAVDVFENQINKLREGDEEIESENDRDEIDNAARFAENIQKFNEGQAERRKTLGLWRDKKKQRTSPKEEEEEEVYTQPLELYSSTLAPPSTNSSNWVKRTNTIH